MPEYVPRQVIVQFKPHVSCRSAKKILRDGRVIVKNQIGESTWGPIFLLQSSANAEEELIKTLLVLAEVSEVSRQRVHRVPKSR